MRKKEDNSKKVTMTDIAALAGVSVSTVSRVLTSSRPVKPEIEKRVLDASRSLDFMPSISSKLMIGSSSTLIACLVPDITSTFFASILSGILKEAERSSFKVVIASSDRDTSKEERCFQEFSSSMVKGLIFAPIARPAFIGDGAASTTLPVVIVARRGVVDGCPHVYSDNIQGAYNATKYLLKLGRRRIAFFAGFWKPPCDRNHLIECASNKMAGAFSSLDRFTGYSKALTEEGLDIDKELAVITGYDFRAGYDAAADLSSRLIEHDAIIAANDVVAAGAMSFLKSQGIKVPLDVSVVGYDDGIVAPLTNPDLTSVQQDAEKIGMSSVTSLLRLIRGEDSKDEIIDTRLIIRGSTAIKQVSTVD